MQATLDTTPRPEDTQDMAGFLDDIATRMDSQHPQTPRSLPGFPERPQPEVHAVVPEHQAPDPEPTQAERPPAHDAFLETNTRLEDITFEPGWLAKAKERWTGAKLRARLALGAIALVATAPTAVAHGVLQDSESKAVGQAIEHVQADEELPIGSGYAEAVERRAEDVDFTIESMVTGKKQWDVLRMETSQSPLQKAQAAAHNAMVGAQSFDPRLTDVLGPDVRSQAEGLLEGEEGALEIDLADDEELFEEAQTGNEITVRGPAAVRNPVSIQTLRPSEAQQSTHNVEFTFIKLGPGEELTLTGMKITPIEDHGATQE